jgi:apoptotic chromatin condensation inducer in the nucleus
MVRALIEQTGAITSFWMDKIKTNCFVEMSSIEEAVNTQRALQNLQWPPVTGRRLQVAFSSKEDMTNAESAPPGEASILPRPEAVPGYRARAMHDALSPRQEAPSRRAPSPVKKASAEEEAGLSLDDLFKKTSTKPRLYWLPVEAPTAAAR